MVASMTYFSHLTSKMDTYKPLVVLGVALHCFTAPIQQPNTGQCLESSIRTPPMLAQPFAQSCRLQRGGGPLQKLIETGYFRYCNDFASYDID
jgi:hypothetical protein